MNIKDLKIGQIITLQKCKHSWLNGLKAEITAIDAKKGDISCTSKEGRHLIGIKNVQASSVREIKTYEEVQIGDIAEENPDAGGVWEGGQIGRILWKGTLAELKKTLYKPLLSNWDMLDEEIEECFDLVVVDDKGYGLTLFNYNNDPSGCVVFK